MWEHPYVGCMCQVFSARAGFDVDANHVFLHGVLATITLMGLWLVLEEPKPIQGVRCSFLLICGRGLPIRMGSVPKVLKKKP